MVKLTCPHVNQEPIMPKKCPLCKRRNLAVHQTLRESLKDSVVKKITIKRIKCKDCHYTFRVYPEGVKGYTRRSKRLVFLGVILYLAGLSFERCEWFLEGMLGKKLQDSVTIWRDIQNLGEKLRRRILFFPRRRRQKEKATVGMDGFYLKVKGEKTPFLLATNTKEGLTIWFGVKDEKKAKEVKQALKEIAKLCEVEALVTDDWEPFKEPIEQEKIPHQVCLAHMKKNMMRRIKRLGNKTPGEIKETLLALVNNPQPPGEETLRRLGKQEFFWTKEGVKAREVLASLLRKWRTYTLYVQNKHIPSTNNVTERAILPTKIRSRLTRGLKSINGALNFVTTTQFFGMQRFAEIAACC